MKKILYIIPILIIAFTSCEGRKSHTKALSESIEAFKAKTTIEKVEYIPENYREIAIDTTLSNGFSIKIKTFTNMNNHITIEDAKDSLFLKKHYRTVNSHISITHQDHNIFEKTIDKSFLITQNERLSDYLTIANLKGVWINQLQSSNSQVVLDIDYCMIETSDCKSLKLNINKDGSYHLISTEDDFL
ncbi:hypothetical protein [Winogradskyella jejuensis]|uniref:Uncharacterized protein n=1 Tax=Winogradskyella jejuensis TaxID=1089305 RepID=A0A1M5TKP3_9FLAO|nr:hypothetical protein [Winogradskyella jejuensis]SHH51246.1 hypothetical protein SAMN05444148_2197 [Winogradskyella jejuensis]